MLESNLAPVVLFVYNRPWHTRQTLEALSKNELANESELYVFADGPKLSASEEELSKIDEVRKIVKEKKWCKSVVLIESDTNRGIEESEIEGVTKIVNQNGKIIVLEDDIITSKYFLKYMNQGLEVYKDISNVYSINGYMYPINTNLYNSVLLPFPCSWGWATWKEKWSEFELEMKNRDFIQSNIFIKNRFNIANSNHHSIINSNTWDIRWMYTLFVRNGLGLSPSKSLTSNIGFDGSGTHFNEKTEVYQTLTDKDIQVIKTNKIDLEFYSLILDYFTKESQQNKISLGTLLVKFHNRLKNRLFKKHK